MQPLAREFIAEIPAQRAAPLMQWLQLLEAPRPSLNLLAMNPQLAVEPDALVSGFTHLSYGDSLDASTLLPLLLARPDMTPGLQGRLRRAAALGAAYGRQPGAVAAFSLLPPEVVDAQVQEWRVRAALWAGAYGQGPAMDRADARQPRNSATLALLARTRSCRGRRSRVGSPFIRRDRGTARLLRLSGGRPAAPELRPEYSSHSRRCGGADGARLRTRVDPRTCAVRLRYGRRCGRGMGRGDRERTAGTQGAGGASGLAVGLVRTIDRHPRSG